MSPRIVGSPGNSAITSVPSSISTLSATGCVGSICTDHTIAFVMFPTPADSPRTVGGRAKLAQPLVTMHLVETDLFRRFVVLTWRLLLAKPTPARVSSPVALERDLMNVARYVVGAPKAASPALRSRGPDMVRRTVVPTAPPCRGVYVVTRRLVGLCQEDSVSVDTPPCFFFFFISLACAFMEYIHIGCMMKEEFALNVPIVGVHATRSTCGRNSQLLVSRWSHRSSRGGVRICCAHARSPFSWLIRLRCSTNLSTRSTSDLSDENIAKWWGYRSRLFGSFCLIHWCGPFQGRTRENGGP